MKWLPLKMNYLPLIFQEINFVTEEYIHLLSKIREKEKNKEENKSKKMNNQNENQSENENEKENENEDDLEIIINTDVQKRFLTTIKHFCGPHWGHKEPDMTE